MKDKSPEDLLGPKGKSVRKGMANLGLLAVEILKLGDYFLIKNVDAGEDKEPVDIKITVKKFDLLDSPGGIAFLIGGSRGCKIGSVLAAIFPAADITLDVDFYRNGLPIVLSTVTPVRDLDINEESHITYKGDGAKTLADYIPEGNEIRNNRSFAQGRPPQGSIDGAFFNKDSKNRDEKPEDKIKGSYFPIGIGRVMSLITLYRAQVRYFFCKAAMTMTLLLTPSISELLKLLILISLTLQSCRLSARMKTLSRT